MNQCFKRKSDNEGGEFVDVVLDVGVAVVVVGRQLLNHGVGHLAIVPLIIDASRGRWVDKMIDKKGGSELLPLLEGDRVGEHLIVEAVHVANYPLVEVELLGVEDKAA